METADRREMEPPLWYLKYFREITQVKTLFSLKSLKRFQITLNNILIRQMVRKNSDLQ